MTQTHDGMTPDEARPNPLYPCRTCGKKLTEDEWPFHSQTHCIQHLVSKVETLQAMVQSRTRIIEAILERLDKLEGHPPKPADYRDIVDYWYWCIEVNRPVFPWDLKGPSGVTCPYCGGSVDVLHNRIDKEKSEQ